MKIAYTISGVFNSGGMENILIHKANYLADELGYDVTIITTDQNNRKTFFPVSNKIKLFDLGINYFEAKSNKLWHFKKLFLKKRHRARLKAYLKKEKYDIVISLMDFDFGFLHSIDDGSKKIIEYHFSKYNKVIEATNPIKKLLQQLRISTWGHIIRKYDKFVVLTHEDKEQWGNFPNIVVIPNFITIDNKKVSDCNNKIAIAVGRFAFQKGFDLLLQSWKTVSLKFPDWKLVLIGGGDQGHYKNIANDLGLTSSVVFKDPSKNISEEYLKSSLFIMSSRYEGFPLVLLEALSIGLPIVSFKCPCGPNDIIKPDFGTLVPCYDTEALSEAIISWISDRLKREKGSEKAKLMSENYRIESVMKKMGFPIQGYKIYRYMISVVIPVYNGEKHISSCLSSLVSQTYTDWEAIIINDGSNDCSLDILYEIARNDDRIKVYSQKNSGVAVARETGIYHSNGEYITFLDIDDTIPSDAVSIFASGFKRDVDIVVGGMALTNNFKIIKENRYKSEIITGDKFLQKLCTGKIKWQLCGKAYKKELFNKIKTPVGLISGEDMAVCLQLAANATSIYIDNRIVYNYHQEETSVTHSANLKLAIDPIKSAEFVENMLEPKSKYKSYFNSLFLLCISNCLRYNDKSIRNLLVTNIKKHTTIKSLVSIPLIKSLNIIAYRYLNTNLIKLIK